MFIRRRALAAFVVALAIAFVSTPTSAGTYEEPEVVDVRLDEATEPGGVTLCQAGVCPPTFQSFPGDLEQAWVGPEDLTNLQFNIQINGTPGAPSTTMQWTWTFHWSLGGTDYVAGVTQMLSGGSFACTGLAETCTMNESAGSSGILELMVPKSAFGDPQAKAVLTSLWVESHGQPGAVAPPGYGAADRAPNSGFGDDYIVIGAPRAPVGSNATNSSSTSSPSAPVSSGSKGSPGPGPIALVLVLALAAFGARRR